MTVATLAYYRFRTMSDDDKLKIYLGLLTWGAGLFATVCFSMLGYLAVTTNDLSRKLSVIEATTIDSREVKELRESIYSLTLKVAKMPEDSPPKWFSDQVTSLEKRVEKLERK